MRHWFKMQSDGPHGPVMLRAGHNPGRLEEGMEYPDKDCKVLFKTADNPDAWRKGMFFWNGSKPEFASYGSEITNVIEWKKWD